MKFITVFDDLIRQVLILRNCTVDDLTQQDIDYCNEVADQITLASMQKAVEACN